MAQVLRTSAILVFRRKRLLDWLNGGIDMTKDAKYWITALGLERHPEGGNFRQTYRAKLEVRALPGFPGPRAASTAIYFLLEADDFSAFHRLRSDEVWHFYAGAPVVVHVIDPAGGYTTILLGNDPAAGQSFQAAAPAGCWFASHVEDGQSWALVGCTVAPGFEFEDFEMAKREELAAKYPQHRAIIERWTRG